MGNLRFVIFTSLKALQGNEFPSAVMKHGPSCEEAVAGSSSRRRGIVVARLLPV
jgi:hypothetical protein